MEKADAFAKKGVDDIVVVSVNDHFVMKAFGNEVGTFLAVRPFFHAVSMCPLASLTSLLSSRVSPSLFRSLSLRHLSSLFRHLSCPQARNAGAGDKLKLFADPHGEFAKAAGLAVDVGGVLGKRSQRYV